jgi:AraC family transcriptional regulator
MKRQIQQAQVLENVYSMTVSDRSWNGILVETTEFTGAGHVLHAFPRQGTTIFSAVLEEVGGRVEPRLAEHRPCPVPHKPRHMVFAPADVGLWGYTDGARYVRDANLYFDIPALEERLGERIDKELVSTPRLRFFDDRIWTLTRLLADACDNSDTAMQLYGDGINPCFEGACTLAAATCRRLPGSTLAAAC